MGMPGREKEWFFPFYHTEFFIRFRFVYLNICFILHFARRCVNGGLRMVQGFLKVPKSEREKREFGEFARK